MSPARTFPSVWRHLPAAAALRGWAAGEVRVIEAALASVLEAWAGDWQVSAPGAIAGMAASEGRAAQPGPWICVGAAAGACAWLQWEPEQAGHIAQRWFGAGAQTGAVVASVLDACRQDALQRIAAALGLAPSAQAPGPAQTLWHSWSGALVMRCDGVGVLLMDAGVVRRFGAGPRPQQPSTPLVCVRDALRSTRMELQVDLDGCELAVGELQGLQVGDVLTLRHRLDAAARVTRPEGDTVLSGWLARVRGRKAVELAAAARAS